MKDVVRQRVRQLYTEVDRQVAAAGPRCDASGRCCRFREYGHTLFLSSLEADLLLDAAPPFAGPVSADFCPWQKDNLCTAREPRPLGCRIYHCDPAFQDQSGQITETALRVLKRLAAEFGLAWRYAPLHFFLEEELASRPPQPPDTEPPSARPRSRIELPLTPG